MVYRVHKVTPSDTLGNVVGVTNGAQNTILQGESTATPGTYTGVKVAPDGGLVINQNTVVDPANSTLVNLAAGATFVGTWVADLTWTAVQYTILADQNCIVYVDQSQNGSTITLTDSFEFNTAQGGTGNTIQLVSSYHRIRVQNIGTVATTALAVQTILVPFLPSLPRSLDVKGNLRTAIYGIKDSSGFTTNNTPHGELLTAPIYRLIGSSFAHATVDPNFWTASLGTGGTAVTTTGELVLSTGTTANNVTSLKTFRSARHVGGTANKFHSSIRLTDAGVTTNNTRQWGVLDVSGTNGALFQFVNGTFSILTRNAGVDSVITNGSFTGELGTTVAFTTNNTEFDIIYLVDSVWFYINGRLLHTNSSLGGAWTADMSLYAYLSNTNTGGSTTNVSLICRHAVVSRLGSPTTQPKDVFLQRVGVDVTSTVKLGAGNLHGIVLSNITNNAVVTLYDNTAASGTVKWASGPLTANGLPFEIDLKDIPFSIGLTVTITGANLNVLVMYE